MASDGGKSTGKEGPHPEEVRDVIPEHVTHLRGVQFTLLVTCIVMVVAVYLSLQERRVTAAANQLENFALAFRDEGAKGWEIAIRDQVWQTFETPALAGSRAPEIPRETAITTWLPDLRLSPSPEAEAVMQKLEERRMIAGSGDYLEFVLDLILLGLPNHSVVLSNPSSRGRTECLGSLRTTTPRRVRELRLFWQNLGNLQAVTLSEGNLKGRYHLFIELTDRHGEQLRSYPVYDGALDLVQARLRAAYDDYVGKALSVDFVAMQPCIVDAGSVPPEARLRRLTGSVGRRQPLLYYRGELSLAPLLTDSAALGLRFLLVPEQQPVRSFDARLAMSDWLGGRRGDGSFGSAFPELAGIGLREVLISERANRRAESDPDWGEQRNLHTGLERLRFDILETDVPLPPRAEDRIDVMGAKVQVEDVVLWGGAVVAAVQFYLLLHLIGFIELLESGRRGELRAPWIGVYRGPLAHSATVVTTAVIPLLICAYLAFRMIERELAPLFTAGGLFVAGLSLVLAAATIHRFRKLWSMT